MYVYGTICERDTFVNNFDRTLPLQLVTIPTFCKSSQVAIIKLLPNFVDFVCQYRNDE